MWLRSKVKILRIIRELFAPISRKMRKSSTGYVAIMVAVAIPVCLYFVNYLISKTHLMEKTLTEQSALYRAGKAVLTVYNPAHTWDNQREAVYAAAASALNESAYSESDRMMLIAESVPIYKASIQENYPAYKFVQRLSPEGMDYNGFTGEKSNGDMLDRVGHELIAGVEADPSGNQYALDRATVDVNESFNGQTREYRLELGTGAFDAGEPCYFRVGAIVDVANSKYNYAPSVKLDL